jgi:ABC-type amino acid transport substrate-binding protein
MDKIGITAVLDLMAKMATIIAMVFAGIAVIFAGLQVARRFKKAPPRESPVENILSEIFFQKIMRVGWFKYPPFIYIDKTISNDDPSGLYPKILTRVAQKHGFAIEWRQINIGDAVNMVKNKKVDMVVSIFQTPYRARFVDVTALLSPFGRVKTPSFSWKLQHYI